MPTTAVRCQAKNPATCRVHGTPAGSLSSVLEQLSTGADVRTLAAQFLAKRSAEETATFSAQSSTNTWEATTFQVAPEGASTLLCPHCKARFTEDMEKNIWGETQTATCYNCEQDIPWHASRWTMDEATGKKRYLGPFDVEVAHDAAKYLSDPSEVLNTVWYHSTDQADWHAGVTEAGLYVHVGTEQAALERFNTQDTEYRDNDFVLHAVRIKPGVTVDDRLFLDENEWANTTDPDKAEDWEPKNVPYTPNKVNRYVNEWEAPGQGSLILNPDLIEVVSTRTLQSKKPKWKDDPDRHKYGSVIPTLNPFQERIVELYESGTILMEDLSPEEQGWLKRHLFLD